MSSEVPDQNSFIKEIVKSCYTDVKNDVEYQFIRPELHSQGILTPDQLSELKVKHETEQIEILFLSYAPKMGIARFMKLINVVHEIYPSVAEKLITKLNAMNAQWSHSSSSTTQNLTIRNAPNSHTAEGYPELPTEFRLTGNECQEDMKRFLTLHGNQMAGQHNATQPGQVQSTNVFTLPGNVSRLNNVTRPAHFNNQIPSTDGCVASYVPGYNGRKIKEPYNMTTTPRGIALIINNENFDDFKERKGSAVDRDNLAIMFHELGWQVITKKDQTAKQMDEILETFATRKILASVSALAVAIFTHGLDNDVLFGTDGMLDKCRQPLPGTFINRFQVMQRFTCSQCPRMENKPKWFILQACRGMEEDILTGNSTPLPIESDLPTTGATPTITTHTRQSYNRRPQPPVKRQTPDTSDMCFLFSSSPGYKAYRKERTGSPFIEALIDCVRRLSPHEEFEKIMKEVRAKMSETKLPGSKMSLSEFSSTLLKEWYLNPVPIDLLLQQQQQWQHQHQ